MALDASSGEIIWTVEEVGNIVTDITVDSTRSSIWLTTTVSFPSRGLTELTTPPFESQVQEYDADSGNWIQQTVLQPAADGEGYILGTQGLALDGDTLWAHYTRSAERADYVSGVFAMLPASSDRILRMY